MSHRIGRRSLRALLFGLGALLSACAHGIPNADPADIPRLQQRAAADPRNTDVQVQLGMAQYKAGDFEAARANLQNAVDAGNSSGPALLYLGMVHEELGNWSLARDQYASYLGDGREGPVRDEVERRLLLIGRNILREQARQALAREDEITATATATPRSVAVLPFAFNSDQQDLLPLVYALSDMMVTDFAVSNALIVLERSQVQTLLDEMALTEAGYAGPETGSRAGRILRAEHVLQGVLTILVAEDMQAVADILNVPSTTSVGELTEAGSLEGLFDMEKQIVIRTIRDVLGLELTPAEEQAILDNRMDNVLAFLAYGRGLREMDRGNYVAAAAEFRTAEALEGADPMIESAMTEVAPLSDAASATGDLGALATTSGEFGGGGFLGPPPSSTTGVATTTGGGTQPLLGGTLTNLSEGVAPTPTASTLDLGSSNQTNEGPKQTGDTAREPIAETTGGEGVTSSGQATIRIVIPRPGASQ